MSEKNKNAISNIDEVICFYESSSNLEIINFVLKEQLPSTPVYLFNQGISALSLYKNKLMSRHRVLFFTDLSEQRVSGEGIVDRLREFEQQNDLAPGIIIALSMKDDRYLRRVSLQYEFDNVVGFSTVLNEKRFANIIKDAENRFRN